MVPVILSRIKQTVNSMMKYIFCVLGISLWYINGAQAQELFLMTEPASTMPKQVLGIRAFNQSYEEVNNKFRTLAGLRLMYGLSPKLSVYLSATASNHHSKYLPPDFPDHNTPQVGVPLPMRLNGVNLYAKYRVLSRDGENSHLRIAAYGEAAYLDVAHDEAEPNLLDDTKGIGAGFITTYLKKHFAVSFTGGFILPGTYHGETPDQLAGLPSVPTKVVYGRALNYSLSFGYLLLPRTYKSYRQTNVNLYVELIGKSYEAAKIFFDNLSNPGTPYEVTGSGTAALRAGHYIEAHPGIQAIFGSNLRVDFSVGFPLLNKSYAHFYPLYTIGIQRYFYFRQKNK